jgi:hypothetical protein
VVFVINTVDLKELVKAIPDETVVGQMTVGSSPIRAATAAEAICFVEECRNESASAEFSFFYTKRSSFDLYIQTYRGVDPSAEGNRRGVGFRSRILATPVTASHFATSQFTNNDGPELRDLVNRYAPTYR